MMKINIIAPCLAHFHFDWNRVKMSRCECVERNVFVEEKRQHQPFFVAHLCD